MNYSTSNEEWRNMWLRQAEFNDVPILPAMVPIEVQARLHGTSGVDAMRGALKFRDIVLNSIKPLKSDSTLLDFGCGWGRHIRTFLKDFRCENIYAVDIDPSNIGLINEFLPGVNGIVCHENVKLPIQSQSIELVISFSVFSHLNESSALFWINELSRVVKDSGRVIITSWGKSLFHIIERIGITGTYEYPWERNIDLSFPDKDVLIKQYNNGDYIFGRHGNTGPNLDGDLYGISLMSKQWIENNSKFVVEEVIDDPRRVPQATFILHV